MTLEQDIWLGERLGLPAYRLHVGPAASVAPRLPRGAFVYAKVPAEHAAAVELLEDAGFHLVDTNVRFARDRRRDAPQPKAAVRPALPADETAVADVAVAGFGYSRFHLDPRVPREVADRIKGDWVRSWFAGRRGDAMLVADVEGRVAGFCQLLRTDTAAVIDLIAVARLARGRGVARALLGAVDALPWEVERVEVGTQVANVPSVRLYESDGFRLIGAEYVLHRHPPEAET